MIKTSRCLRCLPCFPLYLSRCPSLVQTLRFRLRFPQPLLKYFYFSKLETPLVILQYSLDFFFVFCQIYSSKIDFKTRCHICFSICIYRHLKIPRRSRSSDISSHRANLSINARIVFFVTSPML